MRRPGGFGRLRRTPWRAAHYCVVDLELTGLDPRADEIISFGAVPIDDGRVVAGQARYSLVAPARAPSVASVLVHGLRAADLADAPSPAQAFDALATALAGRVLVAHSAEVERAFLGPALRRRGTRLRGPVLDTAAIGRRWLLERDGRAPRGLSLSALAGELSLPAHRPHHSLGDALTTAQVFLALATHLDARRPQTVGSLGRAG